MSSPHALSDSCSEIAPTEPDHYTTKFASECQAWNAADGHTITDLRTNVKSIRGDRLSICLCHSQPWPPLREGSRRDSPESLILKISSATQYGDDSRCIASRFTAPEKIVSTPTANLGEAAYYSCSPEIVWYSSDSSDREGSPSLAPTRPMQKRAMISATSPHCGRSFPFMTP
jgi:hypothetical protein